MPELTPDQARILTELLASHPGSNPEEPLTPDYVQQLAEDRERFRNVFLNPLNPGESVVNPATRGVPLTPGELAPTIDYRQGFLPSTGKAFVSEAVGGTLRIGTNLFDYATGKKLTPALTEAINDTIGMGKEDLPLNTFGNIVGTLAGFAIPMGVIAKGVGAASKALMLADKTGRMAEFAFKSPNLFRFAQHVAEGGLQELTTEEPTLVGAAAFAALDTAFRSRAAATTLARIFKPGSFKTMGTFTRYWNIEKLEWMRLGELESPTVRNLGDAAFALANHTGLAPGELGAAFARSSVIDIFAHASEGMKETFLHKTGSLVHIWTVRPDGTKAYFALDSLKAQTGFMDELLMGAKIEQIAGPKRLIIDFKRAFTEQTAQEANALLDASIAEAVVKKANGEAIEGPVRAVIMNTARNKEHLLNLDNVRNSQRFAKAAREGVMNNTLVVRFENIDPDNATQVNQARSFIKTLYGKSLQAEIPNVYYGPSVLPMPTATFRVMGKNNFPELVTYPLNAGGNLAADTRATLKAQSAELVAFNFNPTYMQDISFRMKVAENLRDLGPGDVLYRRREMLLGNLRKIASTPKAKTPTGRETPQRQGGFKIIEGEVVPLPEGGIRSILDQSIPPTPPLGPTHGMPGGGGPPGGALPEGVNPPPSETVPQLGVRAGTPPARFNATLVKPDGSKESIYISGWTSDGHPMIEGYPLAEVYRYQRGSNIVEWGETRTVPEPPAPPTPRTPRTPAATEGTAVPSPSTNPRNIFHNFAEEARQAGYSDAEVVQAFQHARKGEATLTSRERQLLYDIFPNHVGKWMAIPRGEESPELLAEVLGRRAHLFDQLTQLYRIGDMSTDEYLLRYWLTRNLPDKLVQRLEFLPSKALARMKYFSEGAIGVTEFLENVTRISMLTGANIKGFAHELAEVTLSQLNRASVEDMAVALREEIKSILSGEGAVTMATRYARDPKEMLVEYIAERIGALAFNPSAVKGAVESPLVSAEKSALSEFLRNSWRAVRDVYGVHQVTQKKDIFDVIDKTLADSYWGSKLDSVPLGKTAKQIAHENKLIIEKEISGILNRTVKPVEPFAVQAGGQSGGKVPWAALVNLSALVRQNTFGRIVRMHPDWGKWVSEKKFVPDGWLKKIPRGAGIVKQPDYLVLRIPFSTQEEGARALAWYSNLVGAPTLLKRGQETAMPTLKRVGTRWILQINQDFAGAVIGAGRPSAVTFQEWTIKSLSELGTAGEVHAARVRDEFKAAAKAIGDNLRALGIRDDFFPEFRLTARSGYPSIAFMREIEGRPVRREPMAFAMGALENVTGKTTSTMRGVMEGWRTATTRHWPGGPPQEGTILMFFDREGNEQAVRVTKIHPPIGVEARSYPGGMDALLTDMSKREGWTPEAFKAHFQRGQTVNPTAVQIEFERVTAKTPEKLNIWYGSNENAHLSNLAYRPFTFQGRQFQSVEHAYQSLKSGALDEALYNNQAWRGGGKKLRSALPTKTANNYNLTLMHDLILESFKQNPKAAERLVETTGKELTHIQDRGIWATEFPRILTQVRDELGGEAPSLAYYPGIEITNSALEEMERLGIPKEDAIYGFDDAGRSGATAGRFFRLMGRGNREMGKHGIEVDIVARVQPSGVKWKNWEIVHDNDKLVRIDPEDEVADHIVTGFMERHALEINRVQVFNGVDASLILSRYPTSAKIPRIYIRDPESQSVFWYLRSAKDSFDPTVDKIITTPGYMQRADKYVDDLVGAPPPEVREALEMGYELVGVSGKLPKGRGLHEALEKSIQANVKFPKDIAFNLKPDQFEGIRGMASQAGLDARLTENGIELSRRFNPRNEAPVVVNSFAELRNALGKVFPEEDLVFTKEETDILRPFLEKIAKGVNEEAPLPDPALPGGTKFARKVQETLAKTGLPVDEPARWLGAARGAQNLGFALSAPMYHLAGRLQKALPDWPIWDWYQRAHLGFKQMEHFAGEDVRELTKVLHSLTVPEQRLVTYYLMSGGGGRTLTPSERAILSTFEAQHRELLSPKVRAASDTIREWFEKKGADYTNNFQALHPDETAYINAYVPWRALFAPRMAREGVNQTAGIRPAADAWFTKARLETEFNPMYDDRIGSLVAQYALGGRRMEFLVPVSRDMVNGIKRLEELAIANGNQLPSRTHLYAKWALNNMNNVITGQDGPISSLVYGGMYKMTKMLTGSTKAATWLNDHLLSWGYGVGLGFRPGAALRNAVFAPVPIFAMLGGKHLLRGIEAYRELIVGGKSSEWVKWFDPINTNFGRHFLDQSVPIYRYISGGKEAAQGFTSKALQAGLWMQEATERVNRTLAFLSGISAGEEIFAKFARTPDLTKVLRETAMRMMVEPEQKMLAKALIAGNKEEFVKQFAAGVVRLTQFAYGSIESFMMGNTKGGKLLFFYGTWSANMLHFLGRAAGPVLEDARLRALSPYSVKFLARWGAATGLGWTTYSLMGMNPRSTFALGPTSYTGSPYAQLIMDFADWIREPGRASSQSKIKFIRRAQQLLTPFGAAVADGRKAVEDVQSDKYWNAIVHMFVGTTPMEESELAKAGVRVHKRGWGIW